MGKKKAKLTHAQLAKQVPGLIESRAAKRKALIAAGLNDGRFRTRSGGSDKRSKIRGKFQD